MSSNENKGSNGIMENKIDSNKEVWEAVGVLTNGYYKPSEILEYLEMTYRTYAYNHIALSEKGIVSHEEAASALYVLGVLIDGLKGNFVEEYRKREEARKQHK